MTARVQGGRTATPNAPPANNSLQPGELYVEMAAPLRLWTGVPTSVAPTGTKLVIDTAAQTAANAAAVQKAGDTMTGPLVLSGAPSTPAQAANKAYVDGLSGVVVASTPPALNPGALWWDSVGGQLYIRYNDGNSTAWVVANNAPSFGAATFVGDAPPLNPVIGQLWWESDSGMMFIWFFDGTSSQWVPATVSKQPTSTGWVKITQAAYDALLKPDPNKLYIVVG